MEQQPQLRFSENRLRVIPIHLRILPPEEPTKDIKGHLKKYQTRHHVWVRVSVTAKDSDLVRMQSSSGGIRSASVSWLPGAILPTAGNTNTDVTSSFRNTHTNISMGKTINIY